MNKKPMQLGWGFLLLSVLVTLGQGTGDGCIVDIECPRNASKAGCTSSITIPVGSPCSVNGHMCAMGCCAVDGTCTAEACAKIAQYKEPTGMGDIEVLLKFIISIAMILSINGVVWPLHYIIK